MYYLRRITSEDYLRKLWKINQLSKHMVQTSTYKVFTFFRTTATAEYELFDYIDQIFSKSKGKL